MNRAEGKKRAEKPGGLLMVMQTISRFRFHIASAFMISLLLASCGGGKSGGPAASLNPSVQKTLSWAPPESYTDNSELNPQTELSEYYIYVNETGVFSDSDDPAAIVTAVDSRGVAITSFNLANISFALSPNVTYYVSMRSVTSAGVFSAFSSAVSFVL